MPFHTTHTKLLSTLWARLLDFLMNLFYMSTKVVHTNVLFTSRAVGLLAQVNTLNMVVQQLLCLELFLTVGALVVPDLPMEVFHVVV